jgi:hypothetical protein
MNWLVFLVIEFCKKDPSKSDKQKGLQIFISMLFGMNIPEFDFTGAKIENIFGQFVCPKSNFV